MILLASLSIYKEEAELASFSRFQLLVLLTSINTAASSTAIFKRIFKIAYLACFTFLEIVSLNLRAFNDGHEEGRPEIFYIINLIALLYAALGLYLVYQYESLGPQMASLLTEIL